MARSLDLYMRASALVALLLYLAWTTRVFPARYGVWLKRAAIAAFALAAAVALVETVRWFGGHG